MIACLSIPGFELRAALRLRPGVAVRPAALAPPEGTEPLLGPVTAAAEAAGVRPGMRLGEALALCPSLVLVEADPQGAEREWEEHPRPARGRGHRRLAGRAGDGVLRDAPRRAALRRDRAGAQARARCGGRGLGRADRRGRAEVRRARRGARRRAGAARSSCRTSARASSSRRCRSTCCRCARSSSRS